MRRGRYLAFLGTISWYEQILATRYTVSCFISFVRGRSDVFMRSRASWSIKRLEFCNILSNSNKNDSAEEVKYCPI